MRSQIRNYLKSRIVVGNFGKMNFIGVENFCLVKGIVKRKLHGLEESVCGAQSNF